MKISNIRVESLYNGWTRLVVDVSANFSKSKMLWVSVPDQFADWLTSDVYDCFLVAALYPAMYYHENVEIDGLVSPRLLFNAQQYIMHVIKAYRPSETQFVNISVKGTKIPEQTQRRVATGFSGGVDAFATFIDRYENEIEPERKINTLAFFNVGSHGGGRQGSHEKFLNRYNLIKKFAEERDLPFCLLDSNLYDFYEDSWEYDAGTLTRVFGCLALEKTIRYYYLSGEFSYSEHMDNMFDRYECNIDEMTELYILNLLSTERMEIILEGAQYTRMEKIIKVSEYAPSYQLLNVCVSDCRQNTNAENCSRCFKCVRTMKSLDVIGALDKYEDVFDVGWYKKNRKKLWREYVLYAENWDPMKWGLIEYAREHNFIYLPLKANAFFHLLPEIFMKTIKKISKSIC